MNELIEKLEASVPEGDNPNDEVTLPRWAFELLVEMGRELVALTDYLKVMDQ